MECPICLDVMFEKEVLSCGHSFHSICMLRYSLHADLIKCPLCRKPVSISNNKKYLSSSSSIISFVNSLIIFSTVRLPEVIYSFYTLVKLLNR